MQSKGPGEKVFLQKLKIPSRMQAKGRGEKVVLHIGEVVNMPDCVCEVNRKILR